MKRILSFISAALVVLGVVVNVVPASAATAGSSTGLSINPRKNLIVDQGQTLKDNLQVGNLSRNLDLEISLRVVDFTFFNNSGTPKLSLAQNAPQTTWSIKPFIHLPSTEVIGAGQSIQVPYSVTIPKDQGAGSYYGAIIYSATSGGKGNVNLDASGVSLVFITVPGAVHENLTLQKLGAYTQNKSNSTGSYTYINTQKPTQLAYTLDNKGDVTESPSGSATLKYMFGGNPINISNVNVNSSLALIGQDRLFQTCINNLKQGVSAVGTYTLANVCGPANLKPGYYSASIAIYYGQNGNPTKEVIGSGGFWYLPWWFIAAFIVAVLIIAFLVWKIVRIVRRKLYGSTRTSSRKR
jgi:hypothetical protein